MIHNGCMVAQYQTVINHAQERIEGFEALSRPWWKVSIPPDLFFERAVHFGMSYEVDMTAIKRAMDMFWYRDVNRTNLFFNALPTTVLHPGFLKDLERVLVSSGAPTDQLVLEITESVPYNVLKLTDTLKAVKSMGIRIALDDVGRGSASLSAIAHVEPDFIKIDRSLVDGISQSPEKQRVVAALVDFMGDGSGIVAEGIESQNDLFTAMGLGIELSQGFYWSEAAHLSDVDLLQLELEMKRVTLYRIGTIDGFSYGLPLLIEKSHEIDELVNQVMKRHGPSDTY
ncbi:EAL domain-containing protein [Alicyclobacillus tolerans]|nr:EAL domain-containing protein [Alicyclobacillus tolerans]